MYVPPAFSLDDEAAWAVVREGGAGMLVRTTSTGLASVFVPVVLSSEKTVLTSHVARANSWWRDAIEGEEVLALFLAASSYVSPSYYPSRMENPGVVPTWNYVAAEVHGQLYVHDDAEWLRAQVRTVTDSFEENRSPRWSVDDAPSDFISHQLRAIVGLEIRVTSIEGKAKLSQNRPGIDHDNVALELARRGLAEQNVARRMPRVD